MIGAAMVAIVSSSAVGQEEGPPSDSDPGVATPPLAVEGPSLADRLRSLRESVEALPEGERGDAPQLVNDVAGQLAARDAFRAAEADFRREATEAPNVRARLQEELSHEPEAVRVDLPKDASSTIVQQALDEATATLRLSQDELARLTTERSQREKKGTEYPAANARDQQALADARARVEDLASIGDPTLVQRLRLLLAQSQASRLEAEIASRTAELEKINARKDVLPLRLEREQRRVSRQSKLVDLLQQRLQDAKTAEATAIRDQATAQLREAVDAAVEIRALAETNQSLAAGAGETNEKLLRTSELIQQIQLVYGDLRSEFEATVQQVEAAGDSAVMGQVLRSRQRGINEARALEREARSLMRTQADDFSRSFELEERLRRFDVDEQVREVVRDFDRRNRGSADAELVAAQRAEVERRARELFQARRDILEALEREYGAYVDALQKLPPPTQQLGVLLDDYESFINERILWIRSTDLIAASDVRDVRFAVGRFLSPGVWRDAAVGAWEDFRLRPPSYLIPILLYGLILATRRPVLRQMRLANGLVSQPYTDSMSHTVRAMACSLVLALLWPGVFWLTGWLLRAAAAEGGVVFAVGTALLVTGGFLYVLELVRAIVRPAGLAEAHFQWPDAATRRIRGELRWVTPSVIAVGFVTNAALSLDDETARDSLGRLGFICAMPLLSVLSWRLLHPQGVIAGPLLAKYPGGWLDRLKMVWFSALVATPLLLLILAALGYFYTAFQLERRLLATTWLAIGLAVLGSAAMRWLRIVRRRTEVEHELARKQKTAEGVEPTEEETAEAQSRLAELDERTRKLIRSSTAFAGLLGLWLIWAPVLPALNALDRLELYPNPGIREAAPVEVSGALLPPEPSSSGAVSGSASGSGGGGESAGSGGSAGSGAMSASPASLLTSSGSSVEEASASRPITLASVMLAILVGVLAIAATRDIPGLLEIVLLRRLPFDNAARYAIVSIVRYAIAIVGVAAAFGTLGFSWSQVQWLAAALTFGLAFGLQEIFANFVSGIIILLERPMRVGDVVTIGNVSGTVTKVRMRATVVTDWDRKELVVPNKEFITGQLVNWTLTDPTLRLIVPVGIAYGSDVEKATLLLYRAARDQKTVLRSPRPQVLFLGFGDSSLSFELRVFLATIEDLIWTKDALHRSIDRLFREHGVEIAFPQRDIWIRSKGPESVDAVAGGGSKAGGVDVAAADEGEIEAR